MRRLATAIVSVLFATGLSASCHYGFEADVFNRAVPSLQSGTCVFSPFSLELDCVIFAEAVDTLSRAAVAETIGVLSGFEAEYPPILSRLEAGSEGFSFRSARGFCVPDVSKGDPVFRRMLQRCYGVMICRTFPSAGANSWFRAAMDGEMEDFSVAVDGRGENRFSYYDLVSVRVAWCDPFPMRNSRRLPFVCSDGTRSDVDFMSDVRVVDSLETGEYQLIRLPLKGGLLFYALSPRGAATLDDLRREISSIEISTLIASMGSAADPGVVRGPTVVVLPRLDLETVTDVTETMHDCRCPTRGLMGVAGDIPAKEVVQRVRFRLAECGPDEEPLIDKPTDRQLRIEDCARKAILNRPFLFFVIDESSETILVMGQFDGITRKDRAGTKPKDIGGKKDA